MGVCYNIFMKRKIPVVVWILSFVSFLNDIASEMLYPVMPIFITQVLGAPVFIVGIIEGIAEGSSSLFKTFFGFWSDKVQRRKPFVVAGYSASSVSKIIIALSYAWPLVLVGRIIDSMGKGARTGARDALLLEATDETNKGFIFGFHRAMDSMGAVVGPTIALILLFVFHNNIRPILYIAIVPAFLSLIFFIWVKEAKKKLPVSKINLSLSIKSFPPQLKMFLLGLCVFSLGNSSDSFLILRAKNLGLSLTLIISAYILYNIVYALSSTPAGSISDKIGTKKVFITGIIIFALVYLGFAFDKSGIFVWPLFAIYGFYIGLTDGVSKAMVGSLVDKEQAGTAYGVLNTITSVFTLLASVIGGFLWSLVSPSATFYFAVICAAISIPIFLLIKPKILKA
jgi:MFS family permease